MTVTCDNGGEHDRPTPRREGLPLQGMPPECRRLGANVEKSCQRAVRQLTTRSGSSITSRLLDISVSGDISRYFRLLSPESWPAYPFWAAVPSTCPARAVRAPTLISALALKVMLYESCQREFSATLYRLRAR